MAGSTSYIVHKLGANPREFFTNPRELNIVFSGRCLVVSGKQGGGHMDDNNSLKNIMSKPAGINISAALIILSVLYSLITLFRKPAPENYGLVLFVSAVVNLLLIFSAISIFRLINWVAVMFMLVLYIVVGILGIMGLALSDKIPSILFFTTLVELFYMIGIAYYLHLPKTKELFKVGKQISEERYSKEISLGLYVLAAIFFIFGFSNHGLMTVAAVLAGTAGILNTRN